MSAHGNIAMLRRRRWQSLLKLRRRGTHAIADIVVQNRANSQARFLLGREPILRAKPFRQMVPMLVIPVVGRRRRIDLLLLGNRLGIFGAARSATAKRQSGG